MPHVCQIDERYISHMAQLGAAFTDPQAILTTEYPFVAGIREQFKAFSHVHVLNPIEIFKTVHSRTPVYFANDEHLTQEGHKAVAGFLVEQLRLK